MSTTTMDILKTSASEILPSLRLPDEILERANTSLIEACRAQAPLILRRAVLASFQLPAKKRRKMVPSAMEALPSQTDAPQAAEREMPSAI